MTEQKKIEVTDTPIQGAYSLGVIEERGRIINLINEIQEKDCCKDTDEVFDHILGILEFGSLAVSEHTQKEEVK